ncbi:MAG TPA: hypothetical protein VF530_11665 [Planctomycetota bacterium]
MEWLAYIGPGTGLPLSRSSEPFAWFAVAAVLTFLSVDALGFGRRVAASLLVGGVVAVLASPAAWPGIAMALGVSTVFGAVILLPGLLAELAGRFLHASEAAAYVPRLQRPRLPG